MTVDLTKTTIALRNMTATEKRNSPAVLRNSTLLEVDRSNTGLFGHTFDQVHLTDLDLQLLYAKIGRHIAMQAAKAEIKRRKVVAKKVPKVVKVAMPADFYSTFPQHFVVSTPNFTQLRIANPAQLWLTANGKPKKILNQYANPANKVAYQGLIQTVFEPDEGTVPDVVKAQASNYVKLQKQLDPHGICLRLLALVTYDGDGGYVTGNTLRRLTRFVAYDSCMSVFWEKYEGSSAGGGRNEVIVNGTRMKLTEFLKLSTAQVAKLFNAAVKY